MAEHEHEWVASGDLEVPRCRTCGQAPKNNNFRIPKEECACGGGLLGCEGYTHTLARCGP